jgi:hypothetical protein
LRSYRIVPIHIEGGGSAACTQRVLSAWEKLRRAVARLLVAGAVAQDLLPQANLLLVEHASD